MFIGINSGATTYEREAGGNKSRNGRVRLTKTTIDTKRRREDQRYTNIFSRYQYQTANKLSTNFFVVLRSFHRYGDRACFIHPFHIPSLLRKLRKLKIKIRAIQKQQNKSGYSTSDLGFHLRDHGMPPRSRRDTFYQMLGGHSTFGWAQNNKIDRLRTNNKKGRRTE